MEQLKNNPFRASGRLPDGYKYFYLSSSEKDLKIFGCRETSHPIDAEHFATGNYFLAELDARRAIEWINQKKQWQEWRQEYLDELHRLKRLHAAGQPLI